MSTQARLRKLEHALAIYRDLGHRLGHASALSSTSMPDTWTVPSTASARAGIRRLWQARRLTVLATQGPERAAS